MQSQDYVQSFSKLGKYLYFYALIFILQLIKPIFSNLVPQIILIIPNSGSIYFAYQQFLNYLPQFYIILDIISFALMAVVVAKIRSLEKLSIEGINIRLFPKFFLGFILSIIGYTVDTFYFYFQQFFGELPIGSEFFIHLSIRDLISAIFLIISTVFYFKTWNSLVDSYFTTQKLFTEYRIQKCQNAISLLKTGFILSFIVYGIPIFTNLLAGIYYLNPIVNWMNYIVGLLNSTVYLVTDIILLLAYMNLGGNLRGLSAPKIENYVQPPITDSAAPMFCPQCGNKISTESLFCASCGTKFDFN